MQDLQCEWRLIFFFMLIDHFKRPSKLSACSLVPHSTHYSTHWGHWVKSQVGKWTLLEKTISWTPRGIMNGKHLVSIMCNIMSRQVLASHAEPQDTANEGLFLGLSLSCYTPQNSESAVFSLSPTSHQVQLSLSQVGEWDSFGSFFANFVPVWWWSWHLFSSGSADKICIYLIPLRPSPNSIWPLSHSLFLLDTAKLTLQTVQQSLLALSMVPQGGIGYVLNIFQLNNPKT